MPHIDPRIFFAMADDRLFFPAIARVHSRYRTPHIAISPAALLRIALILTGVPIYFVAFHENRPTR